MEHILESPEGNIRRIVGSQSRYEELLRLGYKEVTEPEKKPKKPRDEPAPGK